MGLVGSLLSLPAMLLFFAAWLAASLSRPLFLVTVVCLMMNPMAAKAKINLIVTTFRFLIFCKDKKWKKSPDPASFFNEGYEDDAAVEKKTVIFFRHGESTWNDTFNKGDRKIGNFLINFIPNLFKAFGTEWYFLASGKSSESWFFDSPLSEKGISQAEALRKFLRDTNPEFSTPKEANLLRLMKGESDEKCQLVSSNLRRAISTLAIGLGDRLAKKSKDDKVIILSELQEVSFNPDALSIHPPKGALLDSWMDSEEVKSVYANQTDTSKNKGNKDINSKGNERMEEFCRIVFNEIEAKHVLATGHSFWFRAFYQTYLPYSFEHVSKKKKMINGAVVGFTLMKKKTPKGDKYMIDPKSLVVLYGGF